MQLTDIFKFISLISPFFVAKVFILILLFFYILFAAIVIRQTDLMNQVLEAKFSPMIHLIALIHLGLTIFIFLLALVIL